MATFTNETSLLTLIPATYREADSDGSLQAFFSVVDSLWSSIVTDMENFDTNVLSPADSMLDNWLRHRGNPFLFAMTIEQKRLLVDGLFRIYKLRGSTRGTIDAIHYLLGLQCSIKFDFEYSWRLGISKLGIDTFLLGVDRPTAHLFTPGVLTPSILESVKSIVEFMKPHWLDIKYMGGAIVAPSSVTVGIDYIAYILPVPGVLTYSWSISNGTIVGGQGTTEITFKATTPGLVTLTVIVTTPSGATTTIALVNAYPAMADLSIDTSEYQFAGELSATAQLAGTFYQVVWEGDNIDIQTHSGGSVLFNIGEAGIHTELRAIVSDPTGVSVTLTKVIKVVPYASAATYTTPIIPVNGYADFIMDLGWQYRIVGAEVSSPACVRVYQSAAARLADAGRALVVDPNANPSDPSIIVFEFTANSEQLAFNSLSVNPVGTNNDIPRTKNAYIRVYNTGTADTAITLTLTRSELQTSAIF